MVGGASTKLHIHTTMNKLYLIFIFLNTPTNTPIFSRLPLLPVFRFTDVAPLIPLTPPDPREETRKGSPVQAVDAKESIRTFSGKKRIEEGCQFGVLTLTSHPLFSSLVTEEKGRPLPQEEAQCWDGCLPNVYCRVMHRGRNSPDADRLRDRPCFLSRSAQADRCKQEK